MQLLGSGQRAMALALGDAASIGLAHGEPIVEGVREDMLGLMEREATGPAVLWGYSQGARVALDFALNHQDLVAGLVIESGTAGIEDENERHARHVADTGLADWIQHNTPEDFAARWEDQPVFASQDPEAIAMQRAIRASHDPMALASALRGLGQASFEPVWDRLHEITAPTLLLTGSRDKRYTEMASRMSNELPNARHVVVVGAGHSVHLECPEESVDEVGRFLAEHVEDQSVE